MAGGQLVVVDDVQALAAVRAGEHRLARAGSCWSQRWQTRPVAHERVRCLARRRVSVRCVSLMRAPETIRPATASVRRLLLAAERDPQLLGEVRREAARAPGRAAQRLEQRLAVGPAQSSGWRASTRFSKSLMRSNRRITLRTALCISSFSMSSVIRSTAVSHHCASFRRRCSVVSRARLAVADRPSLGRPSAAAQPSATRASRASSPTPA